MAHDHHAPARMHLLQIEQGVDDAVLDLAPTLASRNGGDAAVAVPHLPALVFADRIGGQSGPFAEIELDHVFAVVDRQSEPLGKDLRGLARALQRARIDRLDFLGGEPRSDRGDLAAAFRRKPDTWQASIDPPERRRFAMPQQMKDCHVPTPRRSARGIASCPRVPSIFVHCGRWTFTNPPSEA